MTEPLPSSCLYCKQTYPPGVRSREHVLADSLGGSLLLPDGAVCAECNHTLNQSIDSPFQDVFRFWLNMFSIGSSKRPLCQRE